MLYDINGVFDLHNNVIDYLRDTVIKYPNKRALTDKNGTIIFSELYNQAKVLASQIILKTNAVYNKPIAVIMPKCKECVVAFMAIAMSGNFYCPIDTKMPDNRKQKIMNTLEPVLVIKFDNKSSLEYECSELLYNDALSVKGNVDDSIIEKQLSKILSVDPLYVLFTSGSTGNPKGVVVSHVSVIDYIEWTRDTFNFTEQTIFGNQAPFYFDNSVMDIYNMVFSGAEMVVIDEKLFSFSKELFSFMSEKKVNTIFWVPSALIGECKYLENRSNEDLLPELKNILFCGEIMPTKHLSMWQNTYPTVRVANLYGPTEITDVCSYFEIDRIFSDNDILPIGKACRNMEIIIYDEEKQWISSVGEIGEILVRGIGLAKGYYKDIAKTNVAFIQNPLHNDYIDLVYKTGDLGKLCDDGNIIYVGRKDNQVKIQGYRIELGEIEHVATIIAGVNKAYAVVNDEQKIVLLVEASSDDVNQKDIYRKLKANLPRYMLPSEIIIWDGIFPLNQNGKIDRVELRRNIELYRK